MILLFVLPLSPFSISLFYFSFAFFLSTHISISSLFLVSNFPNFPVFSVLLSPPLHLIPFSLLFLSLSSPPPLWVISPLLQSLTWTGGRAAGLLRSCVRDGNHRGDIWCGPCSLAQCGATPPRAVQGDLFACPLGCPQHLLGKEHQGQLQHQHVVIPRQPDRWVLQSKRTRQFTIKQHYTRQ